MNPNSSLQPHRGIMILVLSLVGLFVCIIAAPIAWVMANTDVKAMDAGQMDPEGRGLTQAGKVVAIIACCLAALGIVIFVAALMIGGGIAAFGAN